MDTFKIWILSLCGATAITSLFRILLSNSSLNKVLNIFFTLFVLFYTITPVQSLFDNFNFTEYSDETSVEYDEIYKNGYEQIIVQSIENECKKSEVKVLSYDISSYMNNDNTLIVESIVIDIDNNEMAVDIENQLKEQLGYEVIVE